MYKFKDAEEFHEKYPTKEEKEQALSELDDEEILHLARTCSSMTGKAWYAKHAKCNKGS